MSVYKGVGAVSRLKTDNIYIITSQIPARAELSQFKSALATPNITVMLYQSVYKSGHQRNDKRRT